MNILSGSYHAFVIHIGNSIELLSIFLLKIISCITDYFYILKMYLNDIHFLIKHDDARHQAQPMKMRIHFHDKLSGYQSCFRDQPFCHPYPINPLCLYSFRNPVKMQWIKRSPSASTRRGKYPPGMFSIIP